MFNSFQPVIYQERDDANTERSVWVRVSPDAWGVTIATFKYKPTIETSEQQAMSVVHFDPCFSNQTKIVAWDEHHDSETEDGQEIILVQSIDEFSLWK